jgi:DnaJ-class molecular chaperone
MIEKFYKMLNLTSSATIEEVEQAYQTLKEKYKAERFLEGEAGNDAARRLTEIETAYNAIKNYNAQQINEEKSSKRVSLYSLILGGISLIGVIINFII